MRRLLVSCLAFLAGPSACAHSPAGDDTAGPRPAHALAAPAATRTPAPASSPAVSEKPGTDALSRWALQCYEQGLAHSPVFSRGGHLIIRWAADPSGDLLHVDFSADSFRGWEINSAGVTLADCIVRLARAGKVRWSPSGTAPLRLAPTR